jgi:hypothetical protein
VIPLADCNHLVKFLEEIMKSVLKLGVIGLVLILAISALAGNTGSLRLTNDSTVNGTKLAAGDYKITVDGNGPDVKVIFAQGKTVKATVNGTLAEGTVAPEFTSIVTSKTSDGLVINELHLAKMKGYVKF